MDALISGFYNRLVSPLPDGLLDPGVKLSFPLSNLTAVDAMQGFAFIKEVMAFCLTLAASYTIEYSGYIWHLMTQPSWRNSVI